MIPFAPYLRGLRQRFGMLQGEFAELLGYEQSYISALEIGMRGPPPEAFFEKLIEALQLDESEQNELREVKRRSQRRFALPTNSPTEIFTMCNDLWESLNRIHPAQVHLIQEIIRMPVAARQQDKADCIRIPRKRKREAKM